MKKTKVAIVISRICVGGGQTMVRNLVENLKTCSVHVIVTGERMENEITRRIEQTADSVTYCEGGKLSCYIKFRKALRKVKPDVVHSHLGASQYVALWALTHGKTIVSTMHTVPESAYVKSYEWMFRRLMKKGRCHCVAVSQENYQRGLKYFPECKHLYCINNGICVDDYFKKSHGEFTVINVARQDENKNQIMLIKAFESLIKQGLKGKLVLAGDGPCHGRLEEYVKSNGLEESVRLCGTVSEPEELYAVSDVYVQCSHREGLPMSVIEAMASGLPIVSTDVGGMKDTVGDNGILIPDSNEKELAAAIIKLYENKKLRAEMSKASVLKVSEYSSVKMAEKYSEVYFKSIQK